MQLYHYHVVSKKLKIDRVDVASEGEYLYNYFGGLWDKCELIKKEDGPSVLESMENCLWYSSLYNESYKRHNKNSITLTLVDVSENCGHYHFSKNDIKELIGDLQKVHDNMIDYTV